MLKHKARVVLLSASLVLAGIQVASPAMAQDHERPHGEAPRAQAPQGGRPGPGPSVGAARPGVGGAVGPRPAFDGRGQVLDQRYNHGGYYPRPGFAVNSLPSGYRPYYRGGNPYYFHGGVWYAPRGPGFVVIQPPVGLVINVLPPYYSTVWIGGNPYYYADNVYYTWQPDQNGYAVVDPPDNADQPTAPPESPPDSQSDLIIYPKNGQTKDQQAADQYECYGWAKGQTGFDPTQPGGGVQSGDVDHARNNYNRAMSACLQGRGYQVN